jgi:precorrin-6B methylase 2/predicted transcriptional regulator
MADHGQWMELWAIADLATPMAVRVAATLRIADLVSQGLTAASQLAEATETDQDTLERVLRHLTSAGVLARNDAGRYSLTEMGELLLDDHPAGMRRRLDIEGAIGRADLSFFQLLHSVRTGEDAYSAQFGRKFWEDLSLDDKLSRSFDALMGSDVDAEAPAIVAAYEWGSLEHVVDVGGGNGSLLIALLTAFPTLRGTVVDLPGASEAARQKLARAGLAQRADVVAGSFFDPLPHGAAGYLLSAVIHNWSDDAAREILRRCARAAEGGGAVFVVERPTAEETSSSTARDLRMLAYFGGRERSLAEIAALATESGLEVVAVHPAPPNAIVELAPR